MVKAIDVSGHRYGCLIAVKRIYDQSTRHTKWLFLCDCGREHVAVLDAVRRGKIASCGCRRSEATRVRSLKHGHTVLRKATRTYKSYTHAKDRCLNPNDKKFPNYGGRGITMCQEWRDSFEAFVRDMGECPPGASIDRVDVNGHYEPRNCRWATTRQQARGRTNNVLVEHEGRKIILKDFAALMGVRYRALHAMVKYKGKSPHDAAMALKHKAAA